MKDRLRFSIWLYGGAGALLLLFWLWACIPAALSAVLEGDLCWMVPAVFHGTEGKSGPEILRFIFSDGPPKVAYPIIKGFLYTELSLLSLRMRHLVFSGLLLHAVNSVLVYLLGRQLGLGRRIGFLSAAIHLCLWVSFHAYLWPTAIACHLYSVFFILLTLTLYLVTCRRIKEKRPYRAFYLLTLLATVAGSLGRGTLIAPVLIFTHLLARPAEPEAAAHQRRGTSSAAGTVPPRSQQVEFRRWFPLFVLYSLSLIYWLLKIPEWHGNSLLRKTMPFLEWVPGPFLFRFGLLAVLVGLGVLAASRVLRRLPRLLLWGAVPLTALGLALVDHRQLLLPYNGLVPLAAVWNTFAHPVRAAMTLDSAQPFYFIRPGVEVSGFLAVLLMIGVFFRLYVRRDRTLILLAVWYLLSLIHFLFEYSSQPVVAPSRHYAYITPVFSLLAASVCAALFGHGKPSRTREGLQVALLLWFCIPNLLGIRLAEWRGALTNHYYTYDDIRSSRLIREDLRSKGRAGLPPERIAVRGVVPMPFDRSYWPFIEADPLKHRVFRFTLQEAFDDPSYLRVQVNEARALPGSELYNIEGARIVNGAGRPIEPFQRLLEEGMERFNQGRKEEAAALFREALKVKPYLLRILLPSGCRLDDLPRLTGGLPLRRWLEGIRKEWGKPDRVISKHQRVWEVLDGEMASAERCLLYLSFLERQGGHEPESRRTFGALVFFEESFADLAARMRSDPLVEDHPVLLEFLEQAGANGAFQPPFPPRKDDYGFAFFLLRLCAGLDLQPRDLSA